MLDSPEGLARLAYAAVEMMNRDLKDTSLKTLQGIIWRGAYEAGTVRSHVFDDVTPALGNWADAGLDVRIYSTGSIEAQNPDPGLVRESSCPCGGWKGFSDEEATQCRADRGLASAG